MPFTFQTVLVTTNLLLQGTNPLPVTITTQPLLNVLAASVTNVATNADLVVTDYTTSVVASNYAVSLDRPFSTRVQSSLVSVSNNVVGFKATANVIALLESSDGTYTSSLTMRSNTTPAATNYQYDLGSFGDLMFKSLSSW